MQQHNSEQNVLYLRHADLSDLKCSFRQSCVIEGNSGDGVSSLVDLNDSFLLLGFLLWVELH